MARVLCWVTQSRSTLCETRTAAHQAPLSMGILQARLLEWVATPSSGGSSQPRNQTQVSCIAGRFFTTWATREAWMACKPWETYVHPKCTIIDTFWAEVEALGMQRSVIFWNRDEPKGAGPLTLTWAELRICRCKEGRAYTEKATVFGFKWKDYFLFIWY